MRLTGWEITMAVLGVMYAAGAISIRRDNNRRHRALEALDRARATCPQPPVTQAEVNADIERVADAIREQPRDQAIPYWPATPPPAPPAGGDWDFWEDDLRTGSGL